MASGDVLITVTDNTGAAVLVPSSRTILVMGPCSSGTANTITATQNPSVVTSSLGAGPLVEACGLLTSAGAMVLAMPTTQNAAGVLTGSTATAIAITSTTEATPISVTATAHGLITGSVVTVAGNTETAANGTWVITVTGTNTFTLNGSAGAVSTGTGGTAQPLGIVFSGTGTSTPTVTLNGTVGCFDDYYVQFKCTLGGTIGTGPISFQLSLDAGRNFGPIISLGTATTYAIPNTGITLDFGSGTLVTNDTISFQTTAPSWSTGGVQTAMTTFQNSPYAIGGVGSMLLVGPCTGPNASTIEGYLDTLATGYIYNRLMVNAVDATAPQAWTGSPTAAQTDSAWVSALQTNWSAVSAKRICASAGFYNMTTVYPTASCGTPNYRRPLSWALACRQVIIPIQRHAGRVKLGPLPQIVVNPTLDPLDGFNYHNDGSGGPLDTSRFCSARTRIGKGLGYFISNPNLMAPAGSVFTLLPLGDVMDEACDIVHQVNQDQIDDDLRTNKNGTIYVADALTLQNDTEDALQNLMGSAFSAPPDVSVDQTANIALTKSVPFTVTLYQRTYVLQETVAIGFANYNNPGATNSAA